MLINLISDILSLFDFRQPSVSISVSIFHQKIEVHIKTTLTNMESLHGTTLSNANYILKISINWGEKIKLFTEHMILNWTQNCLLCFPLSFFSHTVVYAVHGNVKLKGTFLP